MSGRSLPVSALLIVVLLAGCGSSGDGGGFADCGNGVVNAGEECDDGNLDDDDACLSTCALNVCGDGFRNVGVEECEPGLLGGSTCASLGFTTGTLACSSACTFDTSGCTGSGQPPTPTSTPSQTSGASAGTPNPSATPTVAGTPSGACGPGGTVVVTESLGKPYAGALVDLHYPGSVIIPGTGSDQSVADRVHFAANGIPATNDTDTNSDSVDDTLSASFVSITDNAAGTYVTVTFDCVEGQEPPAVGDFTCTVTSASSAEGRTITDEQCTLTVTGP